MPCGGGGGIAASLVEKDGKKEGAAAVLALFLCMCGNGTRSGTDFHSAGLWSVAIVLVVLLGMRAPLEETEKERKKGSSFSGAGRLLPAKAIYGYGGGAYRI